MAASAPPIRIREAGAGVTVGGVVLILATRVLTGTLGAAVTVAIGLLYAIAGPERGDRRRLGLGITLVGAIGLVEASRLGLGFDPLVVGLFAIAFGLFDVLLGLIFARFQSRRHER